MPRLHLHLFDPRQILAMYLSSCNICGGGGIPPPPCSDSPVIRVLIPVPSVVSLTCLHPVCLVEANQRIRSRTFLRLSRSVSRDSERPLSPSGYGEFLSSPLDKYHTPSVSCLHLGPVTCSGGGWWFATVSRA